MAAPNENAQAELPDPQEVAQTYAEVAKRASHLISDHVQRQLKKGVAAPADELGIAQAFMDMMAKLLSNPYKLAQSQMNLVWDYFTLWQHSMLRFAGMHAAPVASPERSDKRFKDEEWQEHFMFDFVKQSYLIAARHIHDTVSGVDGLDEQSQKKVNFYTRQYIDALSPSNFALTNPEVFRETVKSHGQNLIKGLNNLLRDVEDGGGQLRVKMTDTTAFELGKNVATTPGKVVFQTDMMQLLQYTPSTDKVLKRPLLIVPPWINKFYILDLREKNSYIKWCVDQGHTVFVISWVNPDEKQSEKTFESYVKEGIIAALDAIEQQTGEKEINAAGYCLGGTLLATTTPSRQVRASRRIAHTSCPRAVAARIIATLESLYGLSPSIGSRMKASLSGRVIIRVPKAGDLHHGDSSMISAPPGAQSARRQHGRGTSPRPDSAPRRPEGPAGMLHQGPAPSRPARRPQRARTARRPHPQASTRLNGRQRSSFTTSITT